MAYSTILVETVDDIATITLNRPEAMNAINSVLLRELVAALEEADRSDKVRSIVLTGSDKAFAAGADVAEMADLSFVEMYRRALYAADMKRPVRCMSIALGLPTARVSRWLPPIPAMIPRLTSGWPNLALSAAMMKSQAIASSQPPPSA
jgi:hypothetical protein